MTEADLLQDAAESEIIDIVTLSVMIRYCIALATHCDLDETALELRRALLGLHLASPQAAAMNGCESRVEMSN